MNTWKDAIVITSVGVAGLGIFGWPVFRTLRARTWPHTRGTVVESTVEADGPSGSDTTSYQARVRYGYVVGGTRYQSERMSFFYLANRHSAARTASTAVAHHRRGSTLDVHYDPKNPANAVVDVTVPWTWWFVLWFSALFAAGGALPMLRAALG